MDKEKLFPDYDVVKVDGRYVGRFRATYKFLNGQRCPFRPSGFSKLVPAEEVDVTLGTNVRVLETGDKGMVFMITNEGVVVRLTSSGSRNKLVTVIRTGMIVGNFQGEIVERFQLEVVVKPPKVKPHVNQMVSFKCGG